MANFRLSMSTRVTWSIFFGVVSVLSGVMALVEGKPPTNNEYVFLLSGCTILLLTIFTKVLVYIYRCSHQVINLNSNITNAYLNALDNSAINPLRGKQQ